MKGHCHAKNHVIFTIEWLVSGRELSLFLEHLIADFRGQKIKLVSREISH